MDASTLTTRTRPEADPPARSARGLTLLAAALALGLLAEVLLQEPPGAGLALWIASVVAGVTLLARRLGIPLRGDGRWLFVPALVFASALAWRASVPLTLLNLLAVLVCLGLAAGTARAGSLGRSGVGEYLWTLLQSGFRTVVGPVLLGAGEVEWAAVARPGRSERVAAVLRGLLLASPLLFLFGALLASADPIFQGLVRGLFAGDWEEALETVLHVSVWTWLAAGYLRTVLLEPVPAEAARPADARRWSIGALEAMVVLAVLDTLFLAFVLVQFRYLFGGVELVLEAAGMSFAEYARRGFFELVAVAALVLPVLLGLDALVERERPRALRALSVGLVGLLLVVIASAAERMRLYQAAYGLTEQRLFATALMAWLAVVFVWFAVTSLRGRPERFAWGALASGLAAVALLNALNPDALIARVNLRRALATERLDTAYLYELSADAVPVLASALDRMPERYACEMAASLLARRHGGAGEGWASWNRSRARAREVVRGRADELSARACIRRPASRRPGRPLRERPAPDALSGAR